MKHISTSLVEETASVSTLPRREIPVAYCWLDRSRTIWVWRFICPYCGHLHAHGGGPLDGDPRCLLGHRVSDLCRDHRGRVLQQHPPLGYILVEGEDKDNQFSGGRR